MNRYRALIFDVDGTLAETEEIHRRAFNETFAHFGLGWEWSVPTYAELLQTTGGKERIRQFARLVDGPSRLDLSDQRVAELHRFKTRRYAELIAAGACRLRPGVAERLRVAEARGQQLAIATTTSRGNVEALLDATLGPIGTSLFSVIVAGDEVDRKKPAPDVYLKVLRDLAVPTDECLAIEDSRNGLVAASQAGISVLITRSVYFRNEDFSGALAVVDGLDQLDDVAISAS
jgi:HAD superfamily hydrolase (TIGR01509 family)